MVRDELACLADHFVDKSLGTVSGQQREVRRLNAVVGITPRSGPDVFALSKAGRE
jgi:hypothetical protein